jgi:membrane protein implicated in regulation of membrane protease activity
MLRGVDWLRMILGSAAFIVVAAVWMIFFEGHLKDVAISALIWMALLLWNVAAQSAGERAEDMERRLKGIEGKLDEVLEQLRERT